MTKSHFTRPTQWPRLPMLAGDRGKGGCGSRNALTLDARGNLFKFFHLDNPSNRGAAQGEFCYNGPMMESAAEGKRQSNSQRWKLGADGRDCIAYQRMLWIARLAAAGCWYGEIAQVLDMSALQVRRIARLPETRRRAAMFVQRLELEALEICLAQGVGPLLDWVKDNRSKIMGRVRRERGSWKAGQS